MEKAVISANNKFFIANFIKNQGEITKIPPKQTPHDFNRGTPVFLNSFLSSQKIQNVRS